MKLDIIEDNYINNHKYSHIWKWFLILFLTIYSLKLFKLIELPELYETIFSFSIGVVILVSLLNSFLFTRIGKFELIENTFISRINDNIKTIELDTIKSVKINTANNNHYNLIFDSDYEVMVEMKNGQLDEFKRICESNNIDIITSNFLKGIKKWFTKAKL